MNSFKKTRFQFALITIFFLLFGIGIQSYGQNTINNQAKMAFKKLQNKQKDDGSWRSVFSFDTIPENFKTEFCSWHNLIMIDLLKPMAKNTQLDSLMLKSMAYVKTVFYDSVSGLVKFGTRIKEYPKDADDTALFWLLNESSDTTLISGIIDTLLKYRDETGLYHIWLREEGCYKLRACGNNPNPLDFLSNIHVYLFLNKYAPDLAIELCNAFSQNSDNLENLWVYNSMTPWLYYIRQIDLEKSGCELAWDDFDGKTTVFTGQEIYTEMAKLIRDLSLGREVETNSTRAWEVLQILSDEKFEYIKTHPIAMFHNDLSARKPAFFWSYDLPYALWLRLYYEYTIKPAK